MVATVDFLSCGCRCDRMAIIRNLLPSIGVFKMSINQMTSIAKITLALCIIGSFATAFVSYAESSHYQDADQAMRRGDYKKASKCYEKVLDADPAHLPALTGFAEAGLARGEMNEARRALEQVKTTNPDFWPAYYIWGLYYELSSQPDQAKAAYQEYMTKSGGNIPPDPKIRIKLRQMGVY